MFDWLKNIDWKTVGYYAKEGAIVAGSAFLAYLPDILHLFPEHTLAFKASIPLSILWRTWRLRQNKKKKTLPSGVERHYDKVIDQVKKVKNIS